MALNRIPDAGLTPEQLAAKDLAQRRRNMEDPETPRQRRERLELAAAQERLRRG